MPENERDTKFAGFATLLHADLQAIMMEALDNNWNNIDMDHRQRELIAQRAYDLAVHVLYETGSGLERVFGIPYKLEQVPDLTEWPPTPTEPQ